MNRPLWWKILKQDNIHTCLILTVADLYSKIVDAPSPTLGPNSFNFMQFWGKFWQNHMLAPPTTPPLPEVGYPASRKSWIRLCNLYDEINILRVPTRTGKPGKWEGIFQSGKSQGIMNRLENHTKYWKTQGI